MNIGKSNPDVWNSIVYIGERQDFFRLAKGLLAGILSLAEKEPSFDEKLSKSKIYVLGTVNGEVIQKIALIYKDSPTYEWLEKQLGKTDAESEEELDRILDEKRNA